MGWMDALTGNASSADPGTVQAEMAAFLVPGERVEQAFKLVRDMFVFTNLRIISIDKQGLSGKKTNYRSIPYPKITQFSKESAGFMDLDAELKIWVGSDQEPLSFEFNRNTPVNDVYRLISEKVLASGR
jgi:hypothetical protein